MMARPLLVPRNRVPFLSRVPGAFAYPLDRNGLFAMLGLGAMQAFLSYFGLLGSIFGAGVFWGYVFSLVRQTGRGNDHIEPPDFSDLFGDVILPAFRGFFATALIWVPALVYLIHAYENPDQWLARGLADPLVWLIVLVGVFFVPLALLSTALGGGIFRIFHPAVLFGTPARLGTDYLVAAAFFAGTQLAAIPVGKLEQALFALPIPFFSRLLAFAVRAYLPFVLARVLGLLVWTRGDVLGYGVETEYADPVLGETRPRGTVDRTRPPEERGLPAPAAAPVVNPEGVLAELRSAIEGKDLDRALPLYASLSPRPPLLSAAEHLFVGQAAASRLDFTLAVQALRAAGNAQPEDPLAPKAFVILARVYAEKMNEPAMAERIYRYVCERYPGSEAAKFAKGKIAQAPATRPSHSR
jgi:hypothetical protein